MSAPTIGLRSFEERLRAVRRQMGWLGVAMLVLGVVALVFPMVSTQAVTLLAGGLFLVFGAMCLGVSFSIAGFGPFFASLLYSLVSIGAGVFLLFNPAAGAVALTLMVGVLFLMQGAYEAVFAFEARPAAGWSAMLASAVASMLLAIIIVGGWPSSSAIVLGVLFGVNFITSGIGLILVSRVRA